MIRPKYDEVDEEDRNAHLGSRTDVLSKSFVTDLWMKVISRAIEDLVSIALMKQQGVPLKDEDKESEETANGFLFDDDYRIPMDDYTVEVTCLSCQTKYKTPMSVFSSEEALCVSCNSIADPKITEFDVTGECTKEISLEELLSIWNLEDIVGFRRGVRERIEVLTEKKSEAAINRASLKTIRKENMTNPTSPIVVIDELEKDYETVLSEELNFAVASEEKLSDFDRGIIKVLDGVKTMLMAKNRKYGNSATNPVRAFSKADPREQIKVRIDDKISRLVRSTDKDEDEDVCDDLIGYLVILTALNKGFIKC
jgi:hypothetical protein